MPSKENRGWVHENYEQDENGNDVVSALSYLPEWNGKFRRALKNDRINETDKCIRYYSLLVTDLRNFMKYDDGSLSSERKGLFKNVCACVEMRMESIQNTKIRKQMTLNEIIKLKPVMANLLSWEEPFPLFLEERSSSKTSLESRDSGLCESFTDDMNNFDIVKADNERKKSANIQQFPALKRKRDFSRCSVYISLINLKYMDVSDPYLMLSFRDCDSVNLTMMQNMVPLKIVGNDIHFNQEIHLQRYLEKVPKGSNLFFELMHMKKGRTKTKCYAVLPSHTLVTGTYKLGLYKPPVDYHLKHLSKFTKRKELYLHVEVRIER